MNLTVAHQHASLINEPGTPVVGTGLVVFPYPSWPCVAYFTLTYHVSVSGS